jgi:hypothetical protein
MPYRVSIAISSADGVSMKLEASEVSLLSPEIINEFRSSVETVVTTGLLGPFVEELGRRSLSSHTSDRLSFPLVISTDTDRDLNWSRFVVTGENLSRIFRKVVELAERPV